MGCDSTIWVAHAKEQQPQVAHLLRQCRRCWDQAQAQGQSFHANWKLVRTPASQTGKKGKGSKGKGKDGKTKGKNKTKKGEQGEGKGEQNLEEERTVATTLANPAEVSALAIVPRTPQCSAPQATPVPAAGLGEALVERLLSTGWRLSRSTTQGWLYWHQGPGTETRDTPPVILEVLQAVLTEQHPQLLPQQGPPPMAPSFRMLRAEVSQPGAQLRMQQLIQRF